MIPPLIRPLGDVPACELQRLGAADIEKVAGHCRNLFEDGTWCAAAVERSLDAPECVALLARTAEQAAGLVLARVAADECEILWLVVLTPWRRKGIGRSLLQAVLRTAARLLWERPRGRGLQCPIVQESAGAGRNMLAAISSGPREH